MTNANELNLQELDQVSGSSAIFGQFVNTPAEAAVLAHEVKELTGFMTRMLPPRWQHPFF